MCYKICKDISSFVECNVHNVLHVVASAGTGGRLGPMAHLHTGARTWALCYKHIYEKTLNFQYIKLTFCMIIALGVHNNIYNFHLGSVSETRCAWWCPDLNPRPFSDNISLGGNCANNRIGLLYKHKLYDTLHDTSALYYWRICKYISSFVECSVHNVLHVVRSAGTGGRLPWLFTHPALMRKIQSLHICNRHADTLYIFCRNAQDPVAANMRC